MTDQTNKGVLILARDALEAVFIDGGVWTDQRQAHLLKGIKDADNKV